MKKTTLFIGSIFLLIFLYACKKNLAQFSTPQPAEIKNIKSFPTFLTGRFKNDENHTELEIFQDQMVQAISFNDTVSSAEKTALEKEKNIQISVLNDSLYLASYQIKDTLFDLKRGDVLKKWKGRYFLNQQTPNQTWEVTQLYYRKNSIALSDISDSENIEKAQNLTETTEDTLPVKTHHVNKKEFKKFIEENGFSNTQIFQRITE